MIPPLLEADRQRRRPRVWSIGHVSDAVAVATAYRHARRSGAPDLQAFVSDFAPDAVRPPPASAGAGIAEHVILAEPRGPVDLVTLRAARVLDESLIGWIRDGGHVVILDGDASVGEHRALHPVGDGLRVYRKCPRGRVAAEPPADGGVAEERAETLAQHLVRSELVTTHAGLARSLAGRFAHRGESLQDIEQVALLALVKAARRYDAGRGASFSTYATASILGEIKRHFRDRTWMLRVPRSVQETYLAVREAREALTQELSRSPTVQQIAGRLDVTDEAVLEAMEAGENYWPASLDVGVHDGDAGREIPVADGGFERTLERIQVAELLPRLTARERLILKRLYFDGWTQKQVASEVGVSQMQVSRLLARTIEKLRGWQA